MMKSIEEKYSTKVHTEVPLSNVSISEEKKVDTLLALMHDIRTSITSWTERSYQSTIWSVGLILTIVGFWLSFGKSEASDYGVLFAIGTVILGLFNQVYLFAARNAHNGNGMVLTKIEVALKLCDKDTYIQGERFFGYSGKWFKSKSLLYLQIMHVLVMIIAFSMIIFTIR